MDTNNSDSNNFVHIFNASGLEKLGWVLVIFSFIVGTWGLDGSFAIIGVLMSVVAAIIGLLKKNWILTIFGCIDAAILISYMNDLAEINSILNSF